MASCGTWLRNVARCGRRIIAAMGPAAHHRLPVLTILHNNRSLYTSEEHAINMAQNRERPVANAPIGTHLDDPAVDFAGLARSFGLYGEGPITSAVELQPAIGR